MLHRCGQRVMRKERAEEKRSGWSGDFDFWHTVTRSCCEINEEPNYFFSTRITRNTVLLQPHRTWVLGFFKPMFHVCSGAFTYLRQHINGSCDVSCQGSSPITQSRRSEAANSPGPALHLTKSREMQTHTQRMRENNSLSYLCTTDFQLGC